MINLSPGSDLLRAAIALAYFLYFLRCAKLVALAAVATGVVLWAAPRPRQTYLPEEVLARPIE
jgi:hypothetical protein